MTSLSARRRIDLGDGISRNCSFLGLQDLIAQRGIDRTKGDNLLMRYFPAEFFSTQNERCWKFYLSKAKKDAASNPYRISPTNVRSLAKNYNTFFQSSYPTNTVTGFAKWIFSLYQNTNSIAMQTGKSKEYEILNHKHKVPSGAPFSDWEPLFIDRLLDESSESLTISILAVCDSPLLGKPDYVFHNKVTGKIIIVEVKVSDRTLPSDGWPNLRGQLWAYAHSDCILNLSSDIILIGEVWSPSGINLLKTWRWELSDPEFYQENEELFSIYKKWAEKSLVRNKQRF